MPRQVLHLIDHMGLGGAQRIISDISSFENYNIWALRTSEEYMESKNQIFHVTDSPSKYNLKCFWEGLKLARSNEFDVLHCHLTKAKYVGLFAKVVSNRDLRLVFHEHGKIMRDSMFYDYFLKVSDKWVDRYVGVSEEAKNLLKNRGISGSKIDVIYNFANRDQFDPAKVESLQLQEEFENSKVDLENDFIVGFAGRIIEIKGWRTFVSSIKNLEDVSAVIAGLGPEEESLQKAVSDINQIEFIGYLDDVRELLGSIDCFVLPSQQDSSPMIVYEVQSAGVPLICSDVVSVNELVENGENGVLFESENSEDLSSVITELKENPELRQQLRDSGLEFARTHTLENYIKELHKTYANAVKSKNDIK